MFDKKKWGKEYRNTPKYKAYIKDYKRKHRTRLNILANIKRKEKRAENPKPFLEKEKRYRSKNLFKIRARVKVYDHIKQGKISRPDVCSRCGRVGKIEAHHADYSKPLDILWVCRPCHYKVHETIDELA